MKRLRLFGLLWLALILGSNFIGAGEFPAATAQDTPPNYVYLFNENTKTLARVAAREPLQDVITFDQNATYLTAGMLKTSFDGRFVGYCAADEAAAPDEYNRYPYILYTYDLSLTPPALQTVEMGIHSSCDVMTFDEFNPFILGVALSDHDFGNPIPDVEPWRVQLYYASTSPRTPNPFITELTPSLLDPAIATEINATQVYFPQGLSLTLGGQFLIKFVPYGVYDGGAVAALNWRYGEGATATVEPIWGKPILDTIGAEIVWGDYDPSLSAANAMPLLPFNVLYRDVKGEEPALIHHTGSGYLIQRAVYVNNGLFVALETSPAPDAQPDQPLDQTRWLILKRSGEIDELLTPLGAQIIGTDSGWYTYYCPWDPATATSTSCILESTNIGTGRTLKLWEGEGGWWFIAAPPLSGAANLTPFPTVTPTP